MGKDKTSATVMGTDEMQRTDSLLEMLRTDSEKLGEKAGVTRDEARAAIDAEHGDINAALQRLLDEDLMRVASPSYGGLSSPPREPPPLAKETKGEETKSSDPRSMCCHALKACGHNALGPMDERFMHGRLYKGPVKAPRVTWSSSKPPRDDHSCPEWLTASEFQDEQAVAKAKVKQLAELLRLSRKTVLYTGAGISASAVGQAARSGQNTQGWKGGDLFAAKPTATHHALGLLGRKGIVQSWVQQNHDGLPQKAGFPQEKINEIHGSWFDPGNPVVKYNGSLHSRSFPWMDDDAFTADLVLVLGTSLGGLTADKVATDCTVRASEGLSLGSVMINLQQTPKDGMMSLRMFGKSDSLLGMLLHELGVGPVVVKQPKWHTDKVQVPYDADGRRVPEGGRRMWLDLSDRQKVRLTPGHNIQGAMQPQFMHIGATKAVTYRGKKRAPGLGVGTVLRREQTHWLLSIDGEGMRLGIWWLEVAMRGQIDVLPVVNAKPTFTG